MRIRKSHRFTLGAVFLLLCGCAATATTSPTSEGAPGLQSAQTATKALALEAAGPAGLRDGLYVLGSSGVFGFPADNSHNGPPFCSLAGFTYVDGNIAFDAKGRMIVPNYAASTITVYDAPTRSKACGKVLGVFKDPYGKPVDATSLDAVSGRILVIAADQVDVCSLQGCTRSLRGPNLDAPAGIALAKSGDCWAEGDEASGPGTLDYFKGCNSDGEATTGYFGGGDNFGGLEIDKYGNILSIFANYRNSPALYVYSGCNPACTMLSGPLPLKGNGTYAHLNKDSTEFAAADTQYSSIDVYRYSPTSLTYEYGFDNELSSVYGVAFNPRAAQ